MTFSGIDLDSVLLLLLILIIALFKNLHATQLNKVLRYNRHLQKNNFQKESHSEKM